jgi:DNA polymerase (family 10)
LWSRLRQPRLPPPELAQALRELADIDELRGNPDAAAELRDAAGRVVSLDPRQLRATLRNPSSGPDTLSPAVRHHVDGLMRQGSRPWLDAAAARLPRDLAGLVRARNRAEVLGWHDPDGIHTIADLRAHPVAGPVGEPLVAAIRRGQPRINLGRALAALEPLLARLDDSLPSAEIVPVGSLRRFEPTVGDISVLVVSDAPRTVIDAALELVDSADIRARSAGAVTFTVEREDISVRIVDPADAGCATLHYTGSQAHLQQLRARAAARGLRLEPRALVETSTGLPRPVPSEEAVYAALDLPWIPPERRFGEDEIALAERGALPTPLRLSDIRGDLHLHTHYSDGRDSTQGIVWAARALGYDYIAITDHSPTAAASRTLSRESLRTQASEIEALRQKHPALTILHGTEVDILEDGRLDFPDEVLRGLDIVLASLHESHGHDGRTLTARYVRAMEHPLVNVITHPANRVPGRSEGYDLDWDVLFRKAAQTGTAVEIDGAPGHIDLDGRLARRAVELGATLVVDSDGHFAERIGRQMRIGVGTAVRGGVEAPHVLNTRPIDDVRAFIAAKRRNAGSG